MLGAKMDKPDHLKLVGMILPADAQEIRSCIDVLERALAEAREGRVLAVAISMVRCRVIKSGFILLRPDEIPQSCWRRHSLRYGGYPRVCGMT
jgi:hypothetical protein